MVAGALVTGSDDAFWQQIKINRAQMGGILGAFEAWLLLRGMRTLFARVPLACRLAQTLAERLTVHPEILDVLYPGLPGFPGHETARRQMAGGFGAMLSIRMKGGATAAIAVAARVGLWKRATSLGGVGSFIEHRASVEGPTSPVPPDLLRLPVGGRGRREELKPVTCLAITGRSNCSVHKTTVVPMSTSMCRRVSAATVYAIASLFWGLGLPGRTVDAANSGPVAGEQVAEVYYDGTEQPATRSLTAGPAAPSHHARGLKFKTPEVYGGFERETPYRALVPPAADLSAYFPPPKDQGNQGSCVAWSVSYAMRGYYANRAMRRGGSQSVALSPSFVYNQIADSSEGCDSGSDIADALALLKETGTVTLSRFPYRDSNCSRRPTADDLNAAAQFRIQSWHTVDISNVVNIKGQIVRGDPVVVGMLIPDDFSELKGDAVYNDTGQDGDGHAMVVVGYDDHRHAFKLMNSWGQDWGQGGFGWVSYNSFKARTSEAYVASVPNLPPLVADPTVSPTTVSPVVKPADNPAVDTPVAPEAPSVTPPPGLKANGQAAFEKFLGARAHKAFAMADDGSFGWTGGQASVDRAAAEAVATCSRYTDTPCRPVRVDDQPVRPSPAADDIDPPEGLSAHGQAAFRTFLSARDYKAFAMSSDGAFGWRSGRASVEDASQEAIAACEQHTDRSCRLVKVDGWQGSNKRKSDHDGN